MRETSLWRNLKTWYNVWNIWNTDSWDTQTFSTPRNWVYWMAKTLNNRFLGKYDEMSMLSRYWNKTWAIYASSDFNWHNNIKKCFWQVIKFIILVKNKIVWQIGNNMCYNLLYKQIWQKNGLLLCALYIKKHKEICK